MTLPESLMVALFCVIGVFLVLLCLCFLIKVFSFILGLFSKTSKPTAVSSAPSQQPAAAAQAAISPAAKEISTGSIILQNVDEPTAAVIMAIVSHQTGIPLSKLDFKSIKLVK